LFIILSDLWYGYGEGLWMHHVKPENARVYGAFIGKRFTRFKNLMWMQAGDRNPDANLLECTRILARELSAELPVDTCPGPDQGIGIRPSRYRPTAKKTTATK
jgi:hypothetical protein